MAFSVPYPHTSFLYYDSFKSLWSFMKYPDSQPSRTIIFVSFSLKRPSLSQDLAYQWRISSFSTAYHCKAPFHSPFQLDLWTSHTAPRHRGVWCPCVVAAAQLNWLKFEDNKDLLSHSAPWRWKQKPNWAMCGGTCQRILHKCARD